MHLCDIIMVFTKHADGKDLTFQCFFLSCFKMNFFNIQFTHELCKVNKSNPMMIRFVEAEMTLKITFLKYDSMIIFNTFVSCVIWLEEKL